MGLMNRLVEYVRQRGGMLSGEVEVQLGIPIWKQYVLARAYRDFSGCQIGAFTVEAHSSQGAGCGAANLPEFSRPLFHTRTTGRISHEKPLLEI